MGVGKAALFQLLKYRMNHWFEFSLLISKSERNLSSVSLSSYSPPFGIGINIGGSLFWWRCSSFIKHFNILENYMKDWSRGLLLILPFSTRCDSYFWLKTSNCRQDWWNNDLRDESISKCSAGASEHIMVSFYLHDKVYNHIWKLASQLNWHRALLSFPYW